MRDLEISNRAGKLFESCFENIFFMPGKKILFRQVDHICREIYLFSLQGITGFSIIVINS